MCHDDGATARNKNPNHFTIMAGRMNGTRRTLESYARGKTIIKNSNDIFRVQRKPKSDRKYTSNMLKWLLSTTSAHSFTFSIWPEPLNRTMSSREKKTRTENAKHFDDIFRFSPHIRGVWWRRALCLHSAIHFCSPAPTWLFLWDFWLFSIWSGIRSSRSFSVSFREQQPPCDRISASSRIFVRAEWRWDFRFFTNWCAGEWW